MRSNVDLPPPEGPTIAVTDPSRKLTLTSFSTTTLPNATLSIAYSQSLSAGGGTAPYTYSLTGSLPAGMTLNTSSGVLSGTVMGVAEFMLYSFDVSFEGKGVCRVGDPMFHNNKNAVG